MQCKLNTKINNNSRTFYPQNTNIWEENQANYYFIFCILQMQHIYKWYLGCSTLHHSKRFFSAKSLRRWWDWDNWRYVWSEKNCEDFRAYKANAVIFLALSSKLFPTGKLLQPQPTLPPAGVCARTKILTCEQLSRM